MPLVIKPAAIHIKDDNGNYYPQNIVAEKTTEEYVTKVTQEGTKQVTAVNSAGSAQVSAVQNKGDTVLASIPSDYTSLQNDVDSLSAGQKRRSIFNPRRCDGLNIQRLL